MTNILDLISRIFLSLVFLVNGYSKVNNIEGTIGWMEMYDLPGVYNLLGFSYRKHSEPNLDKAFDAYQIALEANPEHLGAHEYLGELYITLGKMNKANEMLLKLETLAGTNSMEYRKLKSAIDNS